MNLARVSAALRAIRGAVDHGLLVEAAQLVLAEAFDDLLEQAEHLHSEGYFLAAGVLGRAVLEEHLRNLCGHHGCTPAKQRPTIEDLKSELYKNKHLDKIAMKHVESMATVGNDAAHNKPGLQAQDVERLLRDVRDFLVRNPLT